MTSYLEPLMGIRPNSTGMGPWVVLYQNSSNGSDRLHK